MEAGMTVTEEEIKSAVSIPRLGELAEFRYQLRTFLSFSESASETCGIAAQQYQLMQVIGAAPADRQASISYIAERMILRHNSTVELVDRAERAGLVERRHDEHDLRRSLVQLTPHGWTILQRLVALHLEELHQHAEALMKALRKLQTPGNRTTEQAGEHEKS
jgi:DNA-binding MarR family transcriptional regulator